MQMERTIPAETRTKRGLFRTLLDQKYLLFMSVPFAIVVFIFSYIPIWGWTMAFQKYRPSRSFFEQEWVGLANFVKMFEDPNFYLALKNTLGMSVLGLLIGFTMPIIFALMLNELRNGMFKRFVQTVSYLPHFVSWVVVSGIVYKMLSTDDGPVNQLIALFGHEKVQFMAKSEYFWFIVVLSDLWKELGWNTIIYLSAITAIDGSLYEAAKVDGANRWQLMRHVTLPGISQVIIILLVLSIGHLIAIGFEKQLLLGNPLVSDASQVLDLYALKYGIGQNNFSFGTAIGVINSVVGLALLFTANGFFKKRTGESVI
ncbi:ABC transporter permease [Deinococcus roseus]|uniref:Sugar ABC transporter permease n=1 Tax=Deinococcus roseus TaxID=392414 RepID=A0ABQ2D0D6_9DEIO|nr:ABC transporter permease subunit [Deinococcus roseus]GGJ38671.1 sugar ABC transporter permease [Deinococcus roseus]